MKQENKDKKNLLRNGVWWSAADAFTTPFIIPFGLALGASKIVVGTISSLQQLGMMLSQVPGAEAVWAFKRRRALNNVCELIAKTSWLSVAAIPFLPPESWLTMLLVAVFLSSFFTNLAYPAWASFVADVIPKKIRGRYFSNRNMYMGLVGIIVSLVVGFYLDLFPKDSMLGFSSIFLFGFIVGIVAVAYFARIRGTKLTLPSHHLLDYFEIKGNFRRFLGFNAFFSFSYMIASPFFVVYMLQNLGMDYATYMMFTAIAAFAGLVTQKHWGMALDRFGEKPTMTLCIVGAALVPFFFMFINQDNLLLLIPVQILSGAVWAGIGLATFAMFLDTTEDNKRLIHTADYNIISTMPMIVAPLVGGIIAEKYSFIISGIPLVFLISAIMRLSSLALLRGVKEPHVKKEYSAERVFRMFVSIHPVRGIRQDIRAIDKMVRKATKKL